MGKKKKLFGKHAVEEKVIDDVKELHVEEPVIDENIEQQLFGDLVKEEPVVEDKEEVIEEKHEEVIEEIKEEKEIVLHEHMEITKEVLGFIPAEKQEFEFAGYNVKCVRVKGSRIFIRLLNKI